MGSRRILSLLFLVALPLAACGRSSRAAEEPSAAEPGRAGEAPFPHEPPRGVLLVVVDALRADHVRSLGYDRETTPYLDQMAAEGTSFAQCFASAPLAIPSHVALVSGCEPLLARRVLPEGGGSEEQRWSIPDELPRLPVEMLANGFATAAFVDDRAFSEAFGFDAGFQEFHVSPRQARGAELLAREALQWIKTRGRSERWFLLLHLNDLERCWYVPDLAREDFFQPRPTSSFVPPVGATNDVFFAIPNDRWRGGARTLGQYEAIYDGHLLRVDEAIGRLVDGLRASGQLESTLVSVVGSYGVQFGEAGLVLRSGRYSMADLHVPWIVRVPERWRREGEPRARVADGLASLVDVMPTLLTLSGLEPPRGIRGLSQAAQVLPPELGRDPRSPRPLAFATCGLQEGLAAIAWPGDVLELYFPDRSQEEVLRRSWFGDDRVAESALPARFYDRRRDPFPPLTAAPPEPGAPGYRELRAEAERWYENVTLAQRVLQENLFLHERVDEETVAKLRDAGFLGRPSGGR